MKMRQVPAIEIKAGGETQLQPGGLHIMLIELKAPMREGDNIAITLGFDDGSSKQVDAKVADASLRRLEVDELGLDLMDRRYLMMIADIYRGGPVGVETLAAGLSEAVQIRLEVPAGEGDQFLGLECAFVCGQRQIGHRHGVLQSDDHQEGSGRDAVDPGARLVHAGRP